MKQIKSRLTERGYDASLDMRLSLMQCGGGDGTTVPVPDSLHVVPQGPQVLAMHTIIRDKNTPRDTFIFYSQRLMRIVIEHSLAFIPDAFVPTTVSAGVGAVYEGRRSTVGSNICCVSIMRAGETMEQALRDVVKDCKMGKILIQTNADSMEPELYYTRLPKDVSACRVFVLDAAIATGVRAHTYSVDSCAQVPRQ
jgi:uridine kinase